MSRPKSSPVKPADWLAQHSDLGLVALVIVSTAAIFHLGLFADDFLFLDAAIRQPAREVWLGLHGIAPWYRPLSRELLFYVINWAGPNGLFVAHVLAVLAIATSSISIRILGSRLASPRVGVVAAILFSLGVFTKALGGWASGYQDTLATALTLGALALIVVGRPTLGLMSALAACFAKETAFVVFPLAWVLLVTDRTIAHRKHKILLWAAGAVVVLAIHLLVRASWTGHQSPAPAHGRLPGLGAAFLAFIEHAFHPGLPNTWVQVPVGLLAGGLAAGLAWTASVKLEVHSGNVRRASLIAIAGALMGAIPVLAATLSGAAPPKSYYLYPIWPWLSIMAALAFSGLSRPVLSTGLAILAASALWGTSYEPADLGQTSGWTARSNPWEEVSRLSDVAKRYQADLRQSLLREPNVDVILFLGLPPQSYLQQGVDGPAARVMTGNRALRSYYLTEAPANLDVRRTLILGFDDRVGHLRPWIRSQRVAAHNAMTRIAMNQPRTAEIFGRYGLSDERASPQLSYALAMAELLLHGPKTYLDALRHAGLRDTVATDAASWAAALAPQEDSGLRAAFADVGEHPLSADAHLRLAEVLEHREDLVAAQAERAVAAALRPVP